ncbi:MarR family winged helix-turn-helix transcriptional regulator [Mitsuaria sp. GD03876]|uniref:MarR family winged helix-turn-helix transcriptional regulator n=1 Tax=Mitsuaria sp. GD03876 TaxID=2975399 RepID=UPI00244C04EB|nr:MarR family winged helix-turn-helix transcriptional regulator [Mitsuaria sp. GD03876]MDH0867125.1 MarR family winged helix-turn-helix transcriptional regulator [Mitsuaria sp. GD03876]
MRSKNNVQDAHISKQLRALHGALLTIVSVMNRPQRDEAMVREAGISLDRALFPLLVGIERLGPIGVVELADRAGRDHTTVSRQVAKLESLGLVQRQEGATDRRVREAIVTPKGKRMTDAVDAARERIGRSIFSTWEERDFEELVRLMQKFAAAIEGEGPAGKAESD